MKLFTIGDSISQGFMSAAAARTELCYSTLIARALGLTPGVDYRIPTWPLGGHPVDLERLLRRLQRLYGSDIFGPFEWPAALYTIATFLDDIESHYERGPGAPDVPGPTGYDFFHNVAVRGFDVADAWLVTPELCRQQIQLGDGSGDDDNTFATPSASFYRTALEVLNPSRNAEFEQSSALDWLEHHAKTDGVEILLLWLGSNNALGTVVDLEIIETGAIGSEDPIDMPQPERERFNLWTRAHFEAEYRELLRRVDEIMAQNAFADWRVIVGNVPAVTIAPLAKGVDEAMLMDDPFGVLPKAKYYKYYTYFPFDRDFAEGSTARLTRQEAYYIDRRIADYNADIARLVDEIDAGHRSSRSKTPVRYYLVDISRALLEAAFKRNDGQPIYEFPPYFDTLSLMPNSKYYHADRNGRLVQGGLFSLDGVHPSAIGQGLVAHEFLRTMEEAGIGIPVALDWDAIFASDRLWSQPLRIMQELYEHETLAETLVLFMRR